MAKILLAEDDGPLLRLYTSALKGEHVIIPAITAAEAIKAIDQQRPDLVILDLNMPDAPGTVILDHVAAHPQLADLQVVVMTGFVQYRREALPDFVAEVLSKPVTTSSLLRVIEEALSTQKTR